MLPHMEQQLVELARRLDNIIRIGTIHSVDLSAARVRVTIGKLTTEWLPWLAHRAGTTRQWSAPTVGEQVAVFSPSGDLAAGVVLTGMYSTENPAPSDADDEHVTVYPDGARIAYNHTTGALTATGIQTGTIEAQVKVTIDTPETHITGKLTVDDLLTYGNGLAGNGGANNNFITGDFTHITGDLSSNGVVLHTHTHPGDSGGTTGAPT